MIRKRPILTLILRLGSAVLFLSAIPLATGIWADRHLGMAPWLTLAGMLIGVAISIVEVWRVVRNRYAELERRYDRADDDIKGADA